MTFLPDPFPTTELLASLNEIGAAINQIGQGGTVNVDLALGIILKSVSNIIPDAAASFYFTDPLKLNPGDSSNKTFEISQQNSFGDESDWIRLSKYALSQSRRILSYEEKVGQTDLFDLRPGIRVIGCIPLVIAGHPVGAFNFWISNEREFAPLELSILDNFAHLAAMAIYHAHNLFSIQHALARKDEELIRLRRAGMLISSRLRLKETLESILQMAMEVTGAHYGIFRLLDKSGQFLNTLAVSGEHLARPLIESLPLYSNSVMAWVARERQPVCIADLHEPPWAQIYFPLDASLEMRSELAVPLIGASGRLEGVLNLESPALGAFSEEDSHLLQALATQAVIAIQEVTLLDALQDVAHLLLTQPYQNVLAHLADLACTLLDAATSAIWTRKGDNLWLEVSSGGYDHSDQLPINNSLAGEAVRSRAPVMSEDVRTDERFHRADLAREQYWTRALVVPLLLDNEAEPLGALGVYSSSSNPGRFAESEWDKKVLVCLADYAVLAYQNTIRQEALRASQEQRSIAETFAAVGDIASNLLHHLNNKVGTIPVRIQGIEDKCPDALSANPYLSHNLNEIERCATEAMDSVKESLSHLRPIRLEPVTIANCVNEAVQFSKLPPGIDIQIRNLDDLPDVMAGERTITLVFTNLLENAVEAMDGKGTISFCGSFDDKWVELDISDNGPGIAPELHDHIFELNYSGQSSSRPSKLGFGLWWVKTLTTRLGGSVTVESNGVSGSIFHLFLPRVDPMKKKGSDS
jgi:signal transduction histidine kinase